MTFLLFTRYGLRSRSFDRHGSIYIIDSRGNRLFTRDAKKKMEKIAINSKRAYAPFWMTVLCSGPTHVANACCYSVSTRFPRPTCGKTPTRKRQIWVISARPPWFSLSRRFLSFDLRLVARQTDSIGENWRCARSKIFFFNENFQKCCIIILIAINICIFFLKLII